MMMKRFQTAALALSLATGATVGIAQAQTADTSTNNMEKQAPNTTGTLPKKDGQPSVKHLRGHDASSGTPDASAKNLRGHSETPKPKLQQN